MDLKEFVKETLTQIAQGVSESQAQVYQLGGAVNPAMRGVIAKDAYFGDMHDGQHVFLVDFDVAITATEETRANAKAKLKVATLLSLGGGGGTNESQASTSRIRFKVPLALPVDPEAKKQLHEREAKETAETKAALKNRPNSVAVGFPRRFAPRRSVTGAVAPYG